MDSASLIVPSMGSNGLGRAYSLWLVLRAMGWNVQVVGQGGGRVWAPLAESSFAEVCRAVGSENEIAQVVRAYSPSVVISVKPRMATVARAIASQLDVPHIVDLDDEHLNAQARYRRRLGLVGVKTYREGWRPWREERLRSLIRRSTVTVSNPVLREAWGGTVIPHCREIRRVGGAHTRSVPVVCFAGTNRAHKGVDVLRDACEEIGRQGGCSLEIVGFEDAPRGCWETLRPVQPLEQTLDRVAACDIVAIPSMDGAFARSQLPVKLIDAMLLKRSVISTDLPVLRWATGGHAAFVRPGSTTDLVAAIERLSDPRRRSVQSEALYQHADRLYRPESLVARFAGVIAAAR